MDKKLGRFSVFTVLLVIALMCITSMFVLIYKHAEIDVYNFILLILMMLTIIITLVLIVSATAVFYIYRKKSANKAFIAIAARAGLKLLLPILSFIAGIGGKYKDDIRSFYVDVNNILVQSENRRYPPEKVLILLPHCLQFSDCGYKITNDVSNCRRCGRCCIGDIAALADNRGVIVRVVTGGTAARNVVNKFKPEIVLSVACERDLTSGMADVKNIPVVGIVNLRPNGPCFNTCVDMHILSNKLDEIVAK